MARHPIRGRWLDFRHRNIGVNVDRRWAALALRKLAKRKGVALGTIQ
jgi:hypothetical protein